MSFTHLHLHTEYSLLDGASRIDRLFQACKKYGMQSVAITDHGNMYGILKFHKYAKKYGIKPIFGCELYTCENMKDKSQKGDFFHLVLLVKNEIGYKNLVKLDSLAFVDGFYYKPRVDIELLKKHSEGLVCLSACLGGAIPQKLLADDYDGAKSYAKMLKDIYGEDFYIELQDHNMAEQKEVNPKLVKIARELDIQLVATNDVHYIEKDDAQMHDVLLCIQTGKRLDDEKRMKFETDEFYLKSSEQMEELFSAYPSSIANTQVIADKCNFEPKYKLDLIPNYVPNNGTTPKEFLRNLAFDGIQNRYSELTPEIINRLEYELEIIDRMGFNEYYLIVWDFINYAKKNDIPVGAGRGSGVGSIVAYAVSITNVDPLKYNLLFERFLNPERQSMPDFDIDFCYERRGEVIDYVIDKYGADKVCQIVTFGTMAAKAAIKDVGRVYNIPYQDVDKITKIMQAGSIAELFDLCEEGSKRKHNPIPELVQMYNEDKTVKKIVDMAMRIEDLPRNTSKHAAGVVICKEVISDFVPLQRNNEDITTQFDMKEVESVGLLKMDFLGLRTLTDVKKACQYIEENRGITLDFDKIEFNDEKVYELIGSGDTDAVFQLESAGMKRFMQQLKPECFEDIIAGISLYRPGPMDSIPRYVQGKKYPETIRYKHQKLEHILNVTYGCMVYQEQVMQIVRDLAGFSLGQSDIIRRAMGKKDAAEMAKQREKFIHGEKDSDGNIKIQGAIRLGLDEQTAVSIFDEMQKFAEYAFNKSHAAAYAVLAYQTAYLKRYYLVEFITAVLNNRITNIDDVIKYILYCKAKNIRILPPDINKSKELFSVENGNIRIGLQAIKSCGYQAMENIIKKRESDGTFKSFTDFLTRIDSQYVNKAMIEGLINAGAMDNFGYSRRALMCNYEELLERINKDKKIFSSNQYTFFEQSTTDTNDRFSNQVEYDKKTKLAMEKKVLGIYISGHPLEDFRSKFDSFSFTTAMTKNYEDDEITMKRTYVGIEDNMQVTMGGMLFDIKKRITKNGDEMATAKLEDLTGTIELIFFAKSYANCRAFLYPDTSVTVKGKLSLRDEEEPKILVDSLEVWDETKPKEYQKLFLRFEFEMLNEVQKILQNHKGNIPAIASIGGKPYSLEVKVEKSDALERELLSILTKNDIVWR